MIGNSLGIWATEGRVTEPRCSDDPVGMFIRLHRSDGIFALPDDADPRRDEIIRNLDQIATLIRVKQQTEWRF